MDDCIFCKIAAGDIKTSNVYEDDYVIAFDDIDPKAPVHVIIIPKKHIESIQAVSNEDSMYLSHIISAVKIIAEEKKIDESGYRLLTNHGVDGGQSVFHLHFHLLGGRHLKWPPG